MSPQISGGKLLRWCNNGYRGREGQKPFIFRRKNFEPQHPGDTIHAVTQFPQRGKTPSQRGFNCVTNCVTNAYLCHRFLVTQFALNRFNCHRPSGSNCVTNCVTGGGDTIQGVSGVPSNCVTNCVTALVTQFSVYSGISQGLSGLRCVTSSGDRSLANSIIEGDTKIASNLRLGPWLLAISGTRTSYLR